MFKFASDEMREKMRLKLSDKAVAMNRLVDKPFTIAQCITAFKDGFRDALKVELIPYELTIEQIAYVEQLEKEKYANNDWNFKR